MSANALHFYDRKTDIIYLPQLILINKHQRRRYKNTIQRKLIIFKFINCSGQCPLRYKCIQDDKDTQYDTKRPLQVT